MTDAIARTRKCIEHYRKLGLCPLPSRMDIKGPMLPTYAEHYGPTPVPESVYDEWRTTNTQIITGVKSPTATKIIVVDCDGIEAPPVFRAMCDMNNFDMKGLWVCRTGSGGYHFYFSLPPTVDSCLSGMIYGVWDTWGERGRGGWLKHKEVRILADNALVIAPPSIHVETGERYAFAPEANPNRHRLPAVAPDWLLAMPRLVTPRCYAEPPKPVAPRRQVRTSDRFYNREEVLDAIGEHKLSVAKGWGLATKSDNPNPNGWVTCWVPGREDPMHSNPSGSFHFRDGTFQDRKDLVAISLFDLGVSLGHFTTWQECRDSLGDSYIGKRPKKFAHEYVFS